MNNNHMKLVLLGNTGVGKTSIVHWYIYQKRPRLDIDSTIGAAFNTRTLLLDNNKQVLLHIWDTAGQERYRSLSKMYYRNSHAALIVFSVIDKESFDEVDKWINRYKDHNDKILLFF